MKKTFEFKIVDIVYRPTPNRYESIKDSHLSERTKDEYRGYWASENGVVHFRGLIETTSKAKARKQLEEEFGFELVLKMPSRKGLKNIYNNLNFTPWKSFYFLYLDEVDPNDEIIIQDYKQRNCEHCGKLYTIADQQNSQLETVGYAYRETPFSSVQYCSKKCYDEVQRVRDVELAEREEAIKKRVDKEVHEKLIEHDKVTAPASWPFKDGDKGHPYIYKITNKNTGKCYIGQSSTDYFNRWSAHLTAANHPSGSQYRTKFYSALRESNIEDWAFEVVETIKHYDHNCERLDDTHKQIINKRERHYIKSFNSFRDGYNSR